MEVYTGLNIPVQHARTVVSVGTFDGVHVGHKALLNRMIELARQYSCPAIVITFDQHPRLVLNKEQELKILTTTSEKIRLIQSHGIDILWILPFTREFAELSYRRFVEEYLAGRTGVGHLVIGYDHAFGKGQGGDYPDLLQLSHTLGFSIHRIDAVCINDMVVGSSMIRNALNEGKIATANQMLGYAYSLTGKVIRGNQIGKLIGFPTANIMLDDINKLIPAKGVYACQVLWKGTRYQGMCNIGIRPTIDAHNLTIEAHIFGFDKEIYNDELSIFLIDRIRDEKKFGSLELLKNQLIKDRETIYNLFHSHSVPS